MMKATSKSGKLTAYLEESLHHQPYYIVYIESLHIPIAFIINNDIYELPLENSNRIKIGDMNRYIQDLLELMKVIKDMTMKSIED